MNSKTHLEFKCCNPDVATSFFDLQFGLLGRLGEQDYSAEAYGLYLALATDANIPVDFVDEDALEEPVNHTL